MSTERVEAGLHKTALGMAALMVAIGPLGTAQAADAPIEMQPNSKWHSIHQDNACFLGRSFKAGDREIILSITQFSPGGRFNLQLLGKPFSSDGPYQNVRVAFGPDAAVEPMRDRLSGRSGELPFVDLGSFTLVGATTEDEASTSPLSPAQEAAVTMLTIGPHRGHTYRLILGPMRAPMDALRTCINGLVSHWGYEPATLATIRNPVEPLTNPGTWLRGSDYPREMLRNGQLGSVEIRLDVDQQGTATGCEVLRRAGDAAFAKLTCDTLMRRARFRPALDVAGRPLRSFYINRVNWLIPK